MLQTTKQTILIIITIKYNEMPPSFRLQTLSSFSVALDALQFFKQAFVCADIIMMLRKANQKKNNKKNKKTTTTNAPFAFHKKQILFSQDAVTCFATNASGATARHNAPHAPFLFFISMKMKFDAHTHIHVCIHFAHQRKMVASMKPMLCTYACKRVTIVVSCMSV